MLGITIEVPTEDFIKSVLVYTDYEYDGVQNFESEMQVTVYKGVVYVATFAKKSYNTLLSEILNTKNYVDGINQALRDAYVFYEPKDVEQYKNFTYAYIDIDGEFTNIEYTDMRLLEDDDRLMFVIIKNIHINTK